MKKSFCIIAAFLSFMLVNAQERGNLLKIPNDIPNEKVYVHVNTSMPFVGEYLYFAIYCLQAKNNKPSEISKIAYLDLLDENKLVVHSQTIHIEKGAGYGDYFLPTDFASGNYKLIAYTNWMENNEKNKYFSQDLFIINPYTSLQANIRKDSVGYRNISIRPSSQPENLKLNKNKFQNREKVEVHLSGVPKGNYSVSVRQVDSIPHPEILTANTMNSTTYNYSKSNHYLLPDLRGKLIKGHIYSAIGSSLQNVKLSLTLPGKDFFLRMSNTDEDGNFYFSVDDNFVNNEAIIQIMEDKAINYNINLDSLPKPNIDNLSFQQFGIDSLARKMILDRSVHNQIENAYFSLKPDTVRVNHPNNLFEGLDMIVYNLDDYTRFETVRETFVEVIRYARVRKVNGKYEFGVFGLPPNENYQGEPLVIVDGLPIKDTNDFIRDYKAARIDKIKILQDKYYLGGSVYKGVIIFETINGDFTENYDRDYLKRIKLTTGNIRKDYFQQDYEKSNQSNLPDYRSQLLWLPYLEKDDFQFYTSDVEGIFNISIQGFSDEGEPVSLQYYFEVL